MTTEPSPDGRGGLDLWADYLDWLRAEIVRGVLAVSVADQRRSRLPSGWTPIELLSHVLHMEQRWFVWGFLGESITEPYGDWNVPDPWPSDDADRVRPGARWQVPDDVTATELAERLATVAERTRTVLRTCGPTTPAARGGRFAADPPTLEWICLHVLAEYARHAGHLDIAVELTTGPSGDPL
ncbi:MAG: DUF664 domain-containing protein [Kineosporiaceae bacterium]|nr:DUF664 domain-containing protein [Kineosporiaceae bacterium]